MFRLLMKVPRTVCVAVSGGPDSMAALDFLRNGHNVHVLHFNHGTEHGAQAQEFVLKYVKEHNLTASFGSIVKYGSEIPKGMSKEDFWRRRRYHFFKESTAENQHPLVLAHNLDDAVETWLFSAAHGNPQLIPPARDNIIRPFLLAKKSELRDWCLRKEVPFLDDPANDDVSYARVRLRNVIIPEMLKINPGIHKVVAKKYGAFVNAQEKLKFWLDWVDSHDHVRLTFRGDGKVDLWLYKDFDCMADNTPPSMRPQLIDTADYHPDFQVLMNGLWCGDDFIYAVEKILNE